MDTGTNWSDWFDRINTAALTWYGVYQGQQPNTNPTATIAPTRTGGVSASVSLPMLIVGAAVIIGAVYVYKKA